MRAFKKRAFGGVFKLGAKKRQQGGNSSSR